MQIMRKESSGKTTANGNNIDVRITRKNSNLKVCLIINNLVFSDISLKWLDSIDSRIESASWLSKILPAAFAGLLFTKRPAGGRTSSGIPINSIWGVSAKAELEAVVKPAPRKIDGANWVLFAEAMGSVDQIKRKMVEEDAYRAVLELESDGYSKHNNEIKFFKAIAEGCMP